MTYLISRRPSGEAYFMCAATLITPTVTFAQKQHSWDKICVFLFSRCLSLQHIASMKIGRIAAGIKSLRLFDLWCWYWWHRYVRLGDNYIAKKDPDEQTFQVFYQLVHTLARQRWIKHFPTKLSGFSWITADQAWAGRPDLAPSTVFTSLSSWWRWKEWHSIAQNKVSIIQIYRNIGFRKNPIIANSLRDGFPDQILPKF